jgi:hypothetical protein
MSNFRGLLAIFCRRQQQDNRALADPVLSQPDMEREMVSPPAGAYFPSSTIYHVLPDLPGERTNPDSKESNSVTYFVMSFSLHLYYSLSAFISSCKF